MLHSDLWTVDAHCHWSDTRLFAQTPDHLPAQVAAGVRGFLLGGVDPADWRRQAELRTRFPARIWTAFGLHPYFTARAEADELRAAWDDLHARVLADEPTALGEMGLDFRAPYLGRGRDVQIAPFVQQLALAVKVRKPVILHVVRAHEEALHELSNFAVTGLVHAFSANWPIAERYLARGLHLSLGSRVLFTTAAALREVAVRLPLERLLIESDCPDQAPPGESAHESTTVWKIAKQIAELRKISLKEVIEQTRHNLLALIGKDPPP